jgi:predicted ArsR family transcriptional regulator
MEPARTLETLQFVEAFGGGVTAAELAAKTGLPLSTVRSQMDRLVADGMLVKARASSGVPYRPAWRYRVAGDRFRPNLYHRMLEPVLDHIAAGNEETRGVARAIGRRWGTALGAGGAGRTALDAVLSVLDALGFSPRVMSGPVPEVHLFRCPYLDLVNRYPDAMCRLHAGIVDGVLETTGQPAGTAVVVPFAAPGACVVRIPR